MRYAGWSTGFALGGIPVWAEVWAAGEADGVAVGFAVPGIFFVLGVVAAALFCLLVRRTKQSGSLDTLSDRSCLEHLEQPLLLTDPAGRILYANTAFLKLTGYTREEVVGSGHGELERGGESAVPGDTLDPKGWGGTLRLAGKGGRVLEVHASVRTIRDGADRVWGGLRQYREVTGQARCEADEVHSRLEAVTLLAGGVARDFNNTLAVILNNAEMIQADRSKGESGDDRVERIIKSVLRARDVVKRLLAFSRQGEREVRPFFLRDLVAEAEEMVRQAAPPTVSFCFFRDGQEYPVLADPEQIRRVLLNLCANAVEAMGDGAGSIEVSMEKADPASCLEAGCDRPTPPCGYVRLTVSNPGRGIPPEVRHRMFDPFFTTKEAGLGAGLGLSEARGIVHDHGGAIEVRDRVGGGAEFRVYLPLLDSSSVGISPHAAGKRSILVVDEEAEYLETVCAHLKREGYETHGVSAAPEALELLRRGDIGYDMVIVEQVGTAMAGLDLVERIRVRRPEVPVLLCSGYGEGATEQQAALQNVRMLRKPFTLDELAGTVRFMLIEREEGSFFEGRAANVAHSN